MKFKVFLCHEKDGSYSCCPEDKMDCLPYGLTGEGDTAKEAIDDWYRHYEDMRVLFAEEGRTFVEAEFVFSDDVPSMPD